MILKNFPSGPFETNAYIAGCPETKIVAIIDAPPESAYAINKYLKENNLKPSKLLLTHSHWDHIGDAALLSKQHSIPVYIHPLDLPNLQHPGSDKLPCFMHIEAVQNTLPLLEGMQIPLGNLILEVIETPGHTPGGICLYCADENILFSGDTLFQGTIGNLSFPTANPNAMWTSLKKLGSYPSQTLVYPGHGPSTSIGNEKHFLTDPEKYFTN